MFFIETAILSPNSNLDYMDPDSSRRAALDTRLDLEFRSMVDISSVHRVVEVQVQRPCRARLLIGPPTKNQRSLNLALSNLLLKYEFQDAAWCTSEQMTLIVRSEKRENDFQPGRYLWKNPMLAADEITGTSFLPEAEIHLPE